MARSVEKNVEKNVEEKNGKIIGFEEGKRAIAKKLLANGAEIKFVAKIAELAEEDVAKLQEQFCK